MAQPKAMHLHLTSDGRLIDKSTGKELDPKDHGVTITNGALTYQGMTVSGGGTICMNGMVLSSDSDRTGSVCSVIKQMFWGAGNGNVSVQSGGSVNIANIDGGAAGGQTGGAADATVEYDNAVALLAALPHLDLYDRANAVVMTSAHLLAHTTPSLILQIVELCYLHDRLKTVTALLRMGSFKNWTADNWTALLNVVYLHDRARALKCIMQALPDADITFEHLETVYLYDRAKVAPLVSKFIADKSKKKHAKPQKRKKGEDGDAELKRAIEESMKPAAASSLKPAAGAAASAASAGPASTAAAAAVAAAQDIPFNNPSKLKDAAADAKNEDDACTVCLANKRIVVNVGCGHASICIACVASFKPGAKCPLCQKTASSWLATAK